MDDSDGAGFDHGGVGLLTPGQQLIYDRDTQSCSAFQETLKATGATPITLSPPSPNLNAHAERWVRSVKKEILSRLIMVRENTIRQVPKE